MPRARPKFVEVYMNRHGNAVTYFRRGKGGRIRLPDDPDSSEFIAAYEAALASRAIPHVRDMAVSPIEARKQRSEQTMRTALAHARGRAAKKNLPCEITLDWLLAQLEAQEFRCCMTGIEFFAPHEVKAKVDPLLPSLDRIDPRRGYTPDNVRIVIFALNAMLMDWGIEIFELVANSYRYQKNKRARSIPVLSENVPVPARNTSKIKA